MSSWAASKQEDRLSSALAQSAIKESQLSEGWSKNNTERGLRRWVLPLSCH